MQHRGARPSVEAFVAQSEPSQTVLRKLLLSHEHVPELVEILEREQMSRSALMPTMDNIATDIRKRWLKWSKTTVTMIPLIAQGRPWRVSDPSRCSRPPPLERISARP